MSDQKLVPAAAPGLARFVSRLAQWLVPQRNEEAWDEEWAAEVEVLSRRLATRTARERNAAWRQAAWAALNDAAWLRFHPRANRRRPVELSVMLTADGLTAHRGNEAPTLSPADSDESPRSAAVWADLRFAARRLLRAPLFSSLLLLVVTISTSLIVLMASIAWFTAVRPLPYRDPESLVRITARSPGDAHRDWVSAAELRTWALPSSSLEGLAYSSVFNALWRSGESIENVSRAFVSPNYFDLLGIRPRLGRGFVATGDERSALLGYDFWRARFGADPAIIGGTITLDDDVFTIVGVTPETAYTHEIAKAHIDVWLTRPIDQAAPNSPHTRFFVGVARLASTVDLRSAQSELAARQQILVETAPAAYREWQVEVEDLTETVIGGQRIPMLGLFAAVLSLGVIALANAASLFYGRLMARKSEMALHIALGARAGRLARYAAAEALCLGAAGSAAGVLLARVLLPAARGLLPQDLPRAVEIAINPSIAVAVAVSATLLLLLLAWLPVRIQFARPSGNRPSFDLRGGRSLVRGGWRSTLLAGQVALAVPLVLSCGVLLGGLAALNQRDLGFQTRGIWSARWSLPFTGLETLDRSRDLFPELLRRLQAIPGVKRAGASLYLPMATTPQDHTRVTSRDHPEPGEAPSALLEVATPEWLEVLSLRLVKGRWFDQRDSAESTAVSVIDEELAKRLFTDRDPLGLEVTHDLELFPGQRMTTTVVGVVAGNHHLGPASPIEPQIFLPHAQSPWPAMSVAMRLQSSPAGVFAAAADIARELDSNAAWDSISSLEQARKLILEPARTSSRLASLFSLVALAVATLGLYATLSHQVRGSRREIAVRAALGASPAQVSAAFVRRAAAVIGAGVGVGLLLAWAARAFLRAATVNSDDSALVLSLLLLFGGLGAVTLAASWLPARRAARVSPNEALRET